MYRYGLEEYNIILIIKRNLSTVVYAWSHFPSLTNKTTQHPDSRHTPQVMSDEVNKISAAEIIHSRNKIIAETYFVTKAVICL
jgi:hypothetical protein